MIIESGAGKRIAMKVDDKNRAHTASVSRSEKDAAIDDGRYFIISSEVIELTDDVNTGLLYVENTDTRPLYLDIFISTMGPSSTAGVIKLTTWVGFTADSDIISNANNALVGNSNTTSQKSFEGNVYKGATGEVIDPLAVNFATFILSQEELLSVPVSAVLNQNGSIVYAFQAPSGNNSMEVSIIVTAYYLDEELPK